MEMKPFFYGTIFYPEKPKTEELKFYRGFYEDVILKKNLFYQIMNNGQNKEELEHAACNFLCYLNLFNVNVPKKIRKKEYEDFKETKDLAKIILSGYLDRNNPKSTHNSKL